MAVYLAEGHRGTVYWGREKPAAPMDGDVWITTEPEENYAGHPFPRLRQTVYVWDSGATEPRGWQALATVRHEGPTSD